jgi:hypothetical protein
MEFFISLVFSVIGTGLAFFFGLYLMQYVDREKALLWSIVLGRV